MSPDYKALCAELEGLLIKLREMVLADARFLLDKDSGAGIYGVELDISIDESLTRARTELSQPEPLAPTDEDLLAMRSWSCHGPTFDSDLVDFGRRCYNLGRYGTPTNAADLAAQ